MHNGGVNWQRGSIVIVWAVAVIFSVLIGVFALPGHQFPWIGLALAGCAFMTLCVQIGTGRVEGYVSRVTASIVGSAIVLAAAVVVLSVSGRS